MLSCPMTDPRGPFPTLAIPVVSVALLGAGMNFTAITEAMLATAGANPSRLMVLVQDVLAAHWPVWTWALATAGGVLALRGPLEDIGTDVRAMRRSSRGRCVRCDYDLTGCGAAWCPECGDAVATSGELQQA